MTLKGKLENFGLGELLQTLALNRHTGTLVLDRVDEHKKIYFSTGTITLLSTGKSVRIGEILQREGCVTDAQLNEAFTEQQSSGKLFGQILIEKEYVSLEDVQRALRKKVEEEIYDLFLWPDGTFEFLSDYCPAELMDPLQRFTQLKIDPSALIMEGLRQLDEFKVIRELIPDSRMLCQKVVETPDADLTDEALEIWSLTPSSGPVAAVLSKSPLTRFHSMGYLHEFIKAGWLRGLEFHEHLAVARDERKLNNVEEAAELYRYLLETQPRAQSDREFLKEAGFFLADMHQPELALEALNKALDAYLRTDENSVAWTIGLRLIQLETPSLKLLRAVWPAHRAGTEKSVAEVFGLFAKALFDRREHQELEILLDDGLEARGEESSYWVLRGDNARAMGNTRVATEWYERAIDFLREGRDDPEIIRLLRTIYDLDADREDIAERLKQTLGRQELRESTRRRRHLVAAVFALILVVAFAYATTYEVGARRLFDNTRSLEIAYALDSLSLAQERGTPATKQLEKYETHQSAAADRIRAGYQELIDEYALSTRAESARNAIDRLNTWEHTLRSEVERLTAESEAAERRLREGLQSRFRELRRAEEDALAGRDYRRLREIRILLLEECEPLVDRTTIQFPLYIETSPAGATIEIDGVVVGQSPILYEYTPGSEFNLSLRRVGCEDLSIDFADSEDAILSLVLERQPLAKLYFPPVGGSVISDGEKFYVSSRDGRLYALPNTKSLGHEADWLLPVGVPGHPAAKLSVIGGDLLVGSFDGTIQRLALSGQPIWIQAIDEPLTTLATAEPSEAWVVAGDERGNVYLINAETGEIEQTTNVGFPIEAARVTNTVRVVTRRNQVLTCSIPELTILSTEDYPTAAAGFVPTGELLHRDGTLEGEGPALPAPLSPLRSRDGVTSYVGADRQLVLLEGEKQTTFTVEHEAFSAPIRHEGQIFVSDTEGRLHVYSVAGEELWTIRVGGRCQDIRTDFGGRLLVFLETGGIVIIEGFKP